MTTFTIHVRLQEEQGTSHPVDVDAKDTIGVVVGKSAEVLQVDAGDIALHHYGVALDDMSVGVTLTALGEGSEVDARRSGQSIARGELQRMGIAWGEGCVHTVVVDEEKDEEDVLQAVGLMLEAGGDAKGTAVLEAAARGHLKVVDALVAAGADIHSRDDGCTALHGASYMGSHEAVQYLLSHNVDPTTADNSGTTPIHLAASEGHLDIVKSLLAAGADPCALDTVCRAPIHEAARYEHLDVVKCLVAAGADPRVTDKFGSTPLSHSHTPALSTFLLEATRTDTLPTV